MIDTLAHLRDAQTCLLAAWAKVERATERLTDARSAELTRAQRCSRLAVILVSAALMVAALLGCGVAHADDTQDAQFISELADHDFVAGLDYAKQTVNGDTVTNPPPNDSIWWAFRSACSITGCVATGVALASENPSKQGGMVLATDVLSFADGHWQDTASLRPWTNCPGATNGTTADNEATVSWSWETKPGGTLQGIQTVTVLTNECGHQGMVYRTPVSATRVGDVPPTVVLADPALFTAPPAPATNAHR
jgi:hypothetical protein